MIETARTRPLGSPPAPRVLCGHTHTSRSTHPLPARRPGHTHTHAGTATEPHSAQTSEVHTARGPHTRKTDYGFLVFVLNGSTFVI